MSPPLPSLALGIFSNWFFFFFFFFFHFFFFTFPPCRILAFKAFGVEGEEVAGGGGGVAREWARGDKGSGRTIFQPPQDSSPHHFSQQGEQEEEAVKVAEEATPSHGSKGRQIHHRSQPK